MDYNQIASGLPRSSVLAFGCASIMGRIGKKQSVQALYRAFDAGITHFDVARSYGYGEAESCVGSALKRYREKVVIATKFGVSPPQFSRALRHLKPIAQQIIKIFPASHALAKKSAQTINFKALPGQFSLREAVASVDKSLLSLKTDYIDILFLHECFCRDLTDEIITFLQSLVSAGKIRVYGVATSIDHAVTIQQKFGNQFIFQFPDGVMHANSQKLALQDVAFLTHSPFLKADKLLKYMVNHKNALQSIGLFPLQAEDVYALMLNYSISNNKNGVVIASMLSDNHLRNNIRAIEYPRYTSAQMDSFFQMVRHWMSEKMSVLM